MLPTTNSILHVTYERPIFVQLPETHSYLSHSIIKFALTPLSPSPRLLYASVPHELLSRANGSTLTHHPRALTQCLPQDPASICDMRTPTPVDDPKRGPAFPIGAWECLSGHVESLSGVDDPDDLVNRVVGCSRNC